MSDYPYRYGLKLATDKYTNLTSGAILVKSKRTFYINRWESAIEFEKTIGNLRNNENGIPVIIRENKILPDTGMWVPILRCTSGKWWKLPWDHAKHFKEMIDYNNVMTPMHMFFKDDKEFKAWLTVELYNKLIIDLL